MGWFVVATGAAYCSRGCLRCDHEPRMKAYGVRYGAAAAVEHAPARARAEA